MGLGARLPGTKLTSLSRLSPTSGAPHGHCLFFGDLHDCIMRVYPAARWSILTSAFKREPNCALRKRDDAGDVDRLEHLRLAAKRLRELAAAVGPYLATADWHRRRDIIRTLVQRIEIGLEVIKVIFRLMQEARGSGPESIAADVGPN